MGVETITVSGERFFATFADGAWTLTHAQWSLVGVGDTIEEATDGLLRDAAELGEEMRDDPAILSPQATRLHQFCLGVR